MVKLKEQRLFLWKLGIPIVSGSKARDTGRRSQIGIVKGPIRNIH